MSVGCMCNGEAYYNLYGKARKCKKCGKWKDRPYVPGAAEQTVLLYAEKLLKYDKIPYGCWNSWEAKLVLERLEWKKHPGVKFSKKRKEKIALVKKAIKRHDELWRIALKKKPNKPI